MTVYQQCLFCTRLFEIGPEEHEPMRHHMQFTHQDSTGRGGGGGKPDDSNDRGTRRSFPPPVA